MAHLSSPMRVGIMVFYSILTFFVGPFITKMFMTNDSIVAGFVLGFAVSILLWMTVGKKMY